MRPWHRLYTVPDCPQGAINGAPTKLCAGTIIAGAAVGDALMRPWHRLYTVPDCPQDAINGALTELCAGAINNASPMPP